LILYEYITQWNLIGWPMQLFRKCVTDDSSIFHLLFNPCPGMTSNMERSASVSNVAAIAITHSMTKTRVIIDINKAINNYFSKPLGSKNIIIMTHHVCVKVLLIVEDIGSPTQQPSLAMKTHHKKKHNCNCTQKTTLGIHYYSIDTVTYLEYQQNESRCTCNCNG
jgi:hypothetical protein